MPTGPLLKVIVACSGLVWIVALIVAGTVTASWKLVAPMSIALSSAVTLAWLIDRWGWALPGLRSYFGRPDLRGTWEGTIASDWMPEGRDQKLPPIRAFMVIGETLSALHLRQVAERSDSLTMVCTLQQQNDGEWAVLGLYENHSQAGEVHFGGIRLQARGDTELDGVYWTTRETRGQIAFRRVSRERARSFAGALALAGEEPTPSEERPPGQLSSASSGEASEPPPDFARTSEKAAGRGLEDKPRG